MILECAFKGGTLGAGLEIEFPIEREDAKVITMRARRRTWAVVTDLAEVISPLGSTGWHTLRANLRRVRIDVPNQPMTKQSARRVRIVYDQNKALRFPWYTLKSERRIEVRTFASELGGDRAAGFKRGTADADLRGRHT